MIHLEIVDKDTNLKVKANMVEPAYAVYRAMAVKIQGRYRANIGPNSETMLGMISNSGCPLQIQCLIYFVMGI